MIKRYFYIFSTSLFILFNATTGISAERLDHLLESLSMQTNSPPPSGFNYQAVLRNASGAPLANASVTIKFTLSNAGGNTWVETHTVTTSVHGVITAVIGEGTKASGGAASFELIDWSDTYEIKVEVDSGSGFVNLGKTTLHSVPYANFASNGMTGIQSEKLAGIESGAQANVQSDWNETNNTANDFILNKPTIPTDVNQLTDADGILNAFVFDGSFNSLTNVPANLDTDATNDFSGSFADLTNLPANLDTNSLDDFSGSFADLSNVPANLDTDATDDFSGSFTDLTNIPADLADGDNGIGRKGTGTNSYVIGDPYSIASGAYSLTVGGYGNNAGGDKSFVGGGSYNTASGLHSATIGGNHLTASSNGAVSVGGTQNSAGGFSSTTVGGNNNIAYGSNSITLGGRYLNATSYAEVVMGTFATYATGNASSFTSTDRLLTVGNGTADAYRSDAMVILKNGNTTLNGQLTIDADNTGESSGFTLPGQDGTAGQILTTDGSGAVSWQSAASNAGSGYHSVLSGGFANVASGMYSVVGGGSYNEASQTSATVSGGNNNSATGIRSTVGGGIENNATGSHATSGGGYNNDTQGAFSTISGGKNNEAHNQYNTISGGWHNVAYSGGISIGGGRDNLANNAYSTIAGGRDNKAYGNYSSVVGGRFNTATTYGETVVGIANYPINGNSSYWLATDPVFIVGNGNINEGGKSNALVILKNGNTDLNGTFKAKSLAVDGAFALPTSDGTSGQILTTNGSGTVSWQTVASNSGSGYNSVVSGGYGNEALGNFSVVGGGRNNEANLYNTTVSGGYNNSATATGSTVAGGESNNASNSHSVVSGGYKNTASGNTSTVSGGQGNIASGFRSTLGGGFYNDASGYNSTISGGKQNKAQGSFSSIIGGNSNTASSFGETVIGIYNTPIGSYTSSWSGSDPIFIVGNGLNSDNKSNAMVMLKNGDTDLNGAFTANSLAIEGEFTLPTSDGSSGQVLTTNGSGIVSWQAAASTTGSGYNSVLSGGIFNNASGDFSTVSGGKANYATSEGSVVSGGYSNYASGDHSTISGGNNNTAEGYRSTVGGGASNVASYHFATVGGGSSNTASGYQSFVGGGVSNTASGSKSTTSGGSGNSATGYFSSISGGYTNLVSGSAAFTGGGRDNKVYSDFAVLTGGRQNNVYAYSNYSTIAGGFNNRLKGTRSVVGGGFNNYAKGSFATIPGGRYLNTGSYGETVIGTRNTTVEGNLTSFVATDRLFVVGNGSGYSASDALVMLKNGDTDINGSFVANSLGVDGAFLLPTSDGAAGYALQTNGSGTVSWVDPSTFSSDKRLKTDFRDLTNVLAALEQIDGYRFKWNDVQNRDQDGDQIGFIAQEIQKVYPELVIEDEEGYLRVKYVSFIPILLEAIKELSTQNSALVQRQEQDDKRFAALESKIDMITKLMTLSQTKNEVVQQSGQ